MKRNLLLSAILLSGGVSFEQAAASTVYKEASVATNTAQDDSVVHLICFVGDPLRIYSRPMPYRPGVDNWADLSRDWSAYVLREYGVDTNKLSRSDTWCNWDLTLDQYHAFIENNLSNRHRQVPYPKDADDGGRRAESEARKGAETRKNDTLPGEARTSSPTANLNKTDEAGRLRQEREAEFQAKLAAHKASVEEYERKVAEREAEIARQQAQHAAAQDAAAREKAAYEAKMAAHRRELEEANRRQQEYEAAQRRYMECLSWNKTACDEITAGKPAHAEPTETEEASTDTDANQCVTTAEIRLNASFEGNTSASVMNGCGKPVDIRICLETTSGWNCGVDSAVGPQEQGVHSSFDATGEVFVDAKIVGSNRAFNDPR